MSGATSSQPSLAVAIIVRNAAVELRETLASIGGLKAQLAVLDTGSTDDTIQVARQFGANVQRLPWDDDFAAARNALLDQIHTDWVLWLDAGEHLPPDSVLALHRAFAQPLDLRSAFLLPIVLPPAPRQLGGEQVWQVRLHAAQPAIRFDRRVRERLDGSLAGAGIAVEPLEIPVHRTSRDYDPAVRAARAQRNVRLADLELAADGPTADMYNCLGESLQILGDPLRAAHHYRQALKLAAPASGEALEAHYGLLTCLDAAGPDRQTQLSLCLQAVEHFPLDAQLLVALGGYLQSLGHLPLAIRSFDVAFRHGQVELRQWHLSEIREIAAACAAAASERSGDERATRSLLEAAVTTFPRSVRLGRQLAELHLRHGRRSEAQRVIASLPIDEQQRQDWHSRILRCDGAAAESALPSPAERIRANPAARSSFAQPEN